MTKKKRICKYPRCIYYDPKAETYCCNACSNDAYDHDRLKGQKNYKLIVEYDPDNGLAFTDNKAKEYMYYAIKNRSITPHIIIGNELLITLFRCAVVERKIKHTEIKFLFKGKIINISKVGRCDEWPKGFGDIDMNAAVFLLTYQRKEAVRKAKHRGHKF